MKDDARGARMTRRPKAGFMKPGPQRPGEFIVHRSSH
jgi:hypothetical protein